MDTLKDVHWKFNILRSTILLYEQNFWLKSGYLRAPRDYKTVSKGKVFIKNANRFQSVVTVSHDMLLSLSCSTKKCHK